MTEAAAAHVEADDHRLARLADGLDILIRLHDREFERDLIEELARHDAIRGLGALLSTAEGRAAAAGLAAAVSALGAEPTEDALDELAADFADLYLTHGFRVAPNGSVWLTEERLERQMPMFDVRDWYDHYGVSVPNWRVRADDHLVHELQFVAHLCRLGGPVAAGDAGRFLDLHVLPWVPEFCERAASRVRQPVYAGLMQLTLAYLEELRSCLEGITGRPRAVRAPLPAEGALAPAPEDAPFVPGVAEGW